MTLARRTTIVHSTRQSRSNSSNTPHESAEGGGDDNVPQSQHGEGVLLSGVHGAREEELYRRLDFGGDGHLEGGGKEGGRRPTEEFHAHHGNMS